MATDTREHSMLTYLAQRVVLVVLPTLLGISILVFGAMRLIPGNFVDILIGIGPDVSEEQRDAIARSYGLDAPVPVQYLRWLGHTLRGDMGTSLRTGDPVEAMILDRLPATLELAALATLVSLLIAVPAGVLSAVRRNGVVDALARIVALVGLSIPNFLLGTLLILFISLKWPVLPTTGFVPISDGLWPNLKSLVLPTISLGALLAASIMRMTRSALLEELGKEYLQVARAKGLTNRAVVLGHALRNALVPVVTVVGIQTGYLLGGTVIVEQLFAIPGVGRLALDAVLQRDYPLVQGTTLFIAGSFVLVNLLTDAIYGLIDPRIRRP
jgi:peptide/nickel transport system permease protein